MDDAENAPFDEDAVPDADDDADPNEELANLEDLDKLADSVEKAEGSGVPMPVEGDDEEGSGGGNGYSALVRMGRQRGWVRIADLND